MIFLEARVLVTGWTPTWHDLPTTEPAEFDIDAKESSVALDALDLIAPDPASAARSLRHECHVIRMASLKDFPYALLGYLQEW